MSGLDLAGRVYDCRSPLSSGWREGLESESELEGGLPPVKGPLPHPQKAYAQVREPAQCHSVANRQVSVRSVCVYACIHTLILRILRLLHWLILKT